MTVQPRELLDAIADLKPLEGDFSPRVVVNGYAPGFLPLTGLSDGHLDHLLADALIEEPGGDVKLAAAYLIEMVSRAICEPIVGLAMSGWWLTSAAPGSIGIHRRMAQWEDDGETGECVVFDVAMNVHQTQFTNVSAPITLAESLQIQLSPLVKALRHRSGLSEAALWRLVSDSLASAFLEHGTTLTSAQNAIADARLILRNKATKLSNKQTDFEWVALPEAPETGDWMRVRGGCCRYYTTPRDDADYCTTCVLRDAESRRARYQDYLRRQKD